MMGSGSRKTPPPGIFPPRKIPHLSCKFDHFRKMKVLEFFFCLNINTFLKTKIGGRLRFPPKIIKAWIYAEQASVNGIFRQARRQCLACMGMNAE